MAVTCFWFAITTNWQWGSCSFNCYNSNNTGGYRVWYCNWHNSFIRAAVINFGSISVVILAAIGGVWVPQFMMSDIMINVSKVSPLSWGLNAYYDILLRNSGIVEVLNYIALLVIFFLLCISFAWYYNRIRKLAN